MANSRFKLHKDITTPYLFNVTDLAVNDDKQMRAYFVYTNT